MQSNDQKSFYLEKLVDDLKSRSTSQITLSETDIDAILLEQSEAQKGVEYLKYLIQSYVSVDATQRKVRYRQYFRLIYLFSLLNLKNCLSIVNEALHRN
jgi:hypothetical protein